ncbi:tetratricopeptide repeat protein [Candidatus Peregrinibacteria bacterium]|nr:tetratricopeptide repeat protein [Candidatus Peregrinibacteria bacterium]
MKMPYIKLSNPLVSFHFEMKQIRKGVDIAYIFFIVLFFIEQIFFRKFTIFIFFSSLILLGGIVFHRFLLMKKGFILQEELIHEDEKKKEDAVAVESGENKRHFKMLWGRKRMQAETQEALTLLRKADMLLRAGNAIMEAKKLLIRALAFAPESIEANLKLGMMYLEQNEANKAEAIFRKLIAIKESAIALNALATSLMNQEKYEEAMVYFEKALQLEPKNAESTANMAHACWKLGKKDEAMRYLLKASELDPRNASYLETLIEYHQGRGDLQTEQQLLKKMLFLRPHDEAIKEKLRSFQME